MSACVFLDRIYTHTRQSFKPRLFSMAKFTVDGSSVCDRSILESYNSQGILYLHSCKAFLISTILSNSRQPWEVGHGFRTILE